MAKTSGLGDNFYVGGYDLSGDINSLSKISGTLATIDVTAINESGMERLGGKRDGAVDFTAYFNPTGAHPVLSALPTSDVQASYRRGTVLGNPAAEIVARQLNYDPTRGADGALTVACSLSGDGFGLEWGIQLTPGCAPTPRPPTAPASTRPTGWRHPLYRRPGPRRRTRRRYRSRSSSAAAR